MGYTENNLKENKLISSTIEVTRGFLLHLSVWTRNSLILPKIYSVREESCSYNKVEQHFTNTRPIGPPKALSALPELRNTSSAIKLLYKEE